MVHGQLLLGPVHCPPGHLSVETTKAVFDINESEFEKYVQTDGVLLSVYSAHYLPYLFYDRTLFLHHHLPAYIFKLMLLGYFISHMPYLLRKMT